MYATASEGNELFEIEHRLITLLMCNETALKLCLMEKQIELCSPKVCRHRKNKKSMNYVYSKTKFEM